MGSSVHAVKIAGAGTVASTGLVAAARSSAAGDGGIVVAVVNVLDTAQTVAVAQGAARTGGGGACGLYLLQPTNGSATDTSAVVNGVAPTVHLDGSVPALVPRAAPCGAVLLPGGSIAYITVPAGRA